MSPRKRKLETALESLFSSARQSFQPGALTEPVLVTPTLPVADLKDFQEPAFQPIIRTAVEGVTEERAEACEASRALQPLASIKPGVQSAQADVPRPAPIQPPEAEALPVEGGTAILTQGEQILVFTLAEVAYGLEVRQVESIIKMQSITPVPHAWPWVSGVTNLRGTVLPVIDLRKRFGLPAVRAGKNTRIIVVNVQEEKVGLLVDSVCEVLRLPPGAVETPPDLSTGANSGFIRGIANQVEKMTVLLNLNQVISAGLCV